MLSDAGLPEMKDTKLAPSEMGRGIHVANRNARRLLGDGILLYESARYPSAAALAVLAMEEAAKWSTLLHVTIAQDEKRIRESWRMNTLHIPKLTRALRALMGAHEASGGDRPTVPDAELAKAMNALKLSCIYTAFVVGRRWIDPMQVCDRDECHNQLSVALISTSGHLRVTGQRLGALFKRVPGRLADEREEAARQTLISWSEGEEAAALAADDDAENEAFRADAKKRLRLQGESDAS
jgi:AbiV family abortive infection protein